MYNVAELFKKRQVPRTIQLKVNQYATIKQEQSKRLSIMQRQGLARFQKSLVPYLSLNIICQTAGKSFGM